MINFFNNSGNVLIYLLIIPVYFFFKVMVKNISQVGYQNVIHFVLSMQRRNVKPRSNSHCTLALLLGWTLDWGKTLSWFIVN